jgi:hypothetical protein
VYNWYMELGGCPLFTHETHGWDVRIFTISEAWALDHRGDAYKYGAPQCNDFACCMPSTGWDNMAYLNVPGNQGALPNPTVTVVSYKPPPPSSPPLPFVPSATQDGAIIEMTGDDPKLVFGTLESPICQLSIDRSNSRLVSTCAIQESRRLEETVDCEVKYSVLAQKCETLRLEVSEMRRLVDELKATKVE